MKKWIVIILILYYQPLIGQQPHMLQFTDENGLPSSTVYQILQDRKDYIWIGTARGLVRYDGRKFETIDLSTLLDKEIVFLKEDYLGRIWINNLSGEVGWIENMELHLPKFDGLNENKLPGRFTIRDSTIILNYFDEVRQLLIYDLNRDGSLSSRAFPFTEIYTSKLSQYYFEESIYFEKIRYRDNHLCFNYLHNDSIKEHCQIHFFEDIKMGDEDFFLNGIDNRGRLLMSNKLIFIRYDIANNTSEIIYDCSANRINACDVKDNNIWLFSKNGIIVFDAHTLEKKMVMLDGINSHISFEDREKNTWFPTTAHGIYLMYNMNSLIYTPSNSKIPKSDIYSIYYDDLEGSLYLGMSGGYLSRIEIKTENFTNYKLPVSGRLIAMEWDEHDMLWMGLDDGICILDRDSDAIIKTRYSYAIKALKATKSGEMWCGNSSMIAKWQNHQKSIGKIYQDVIMYKRTYSVVEDHNSQIWIGTTDGLYSYRDEKVTPFLNGDNDKFSITDIVISMDSSLWVATANEGVLQIKHDKIVGRYTQDDGLASNNCISLFSLNDTLLIGTDRGLSMLDNKSGKVISINIRDGLPSDEINCITTNGSIIWMGTPKGLVAMNIDRLTSNENRPPILLEGLSVNGEKFNLSNLNSFEYWQNTLDFEYVGIDIKSNQNESYIYRLKGLDDEWHATPSQNARFHTLRPGDYMFEVKSVNDIGVESSTTAKLAFTIKKPWWKSVWFYIGSTFIAAIIMSIILMWRNNEKKKRARIENKLKERIHELKTEALKSQMNPHFIYNSLNAIQDFFITHDDESALLYLSKFAHLIRLIFDYSGKNTITLHEELEFISLYLDLEKLRFGDRVDVIFEIDNSLKDFAMQYQMPPLLLQPIIENVFKHGLMHRLEGGVVKIQFKDEEGYIKCTIEDNGIGRKAANKMKNWRQKTRSYGGLQAVEERLILWRKDSNINPLEIRDLENSDGKPLGTRITVTI